MFVVGITGGIGSGKSTVAELFRELDIPVYDADVEARALVEPGQAAFDQVSAEFGPSILTRDGAIDRAKLRALIFSDPTARRRLENILHPRVKEELRAKIQHTAPATAPYCVIVVPLLFEANHIDLADRILVVDAPEAVQIQRTLQRPGMTAEAAQQIIAAQWSRKQRLARADDVIVNDVGIDALRPQVATLHVRYLDAARGA